VLIVLNSKLIMLIFEAWNEYVLWVFMEEIGFGCEMCDYVHKVGSDWNFVDLCMCFEWNFEGLCVCAYKIWFGCVVVM